MATKTAKTSKPKARKAGRGAHKATHSRAPSPSPAAGPRNNGAYAAMRREYEASYPKSRERKDLYPYTLSGEPVAPL